jgi:hypothetical protein
MLKVLLSLILVLKSCKTFVELFHPCHNISVLLTGEN